MITKITISADTVSKLPAIFEDAFIVNDSKQLQLSEYATPHVVLLGIDDYNGFEYAHRATETAFEIAREEQDADPASLLVDALKASDVDAYIVSDSDTEIDYYFALAYAVRKLQF